MLKETLAKSEITFSWTEYAVEYLSELGYDPLLGARPLKRVIQRRVINELSKQIISGKIDKGSNVILDMFEKEFVFRSK